MKLKMLGYAKEERNKKKKEQVTKEKLNDCGIQILMEWIVAYLDSSMSQQKGVNHPQTSGKIERFYGTLEAKMRYLER